MANYYLAIDIGASSGRHILGCVRDGRIILEEVHRFDNRQVRRSGHDCWDLDHLWDSILEGLRACKALGKIPASIGIDTWAVDYVLLDQNDRLVGDAVAYRDKRTEGAEELIADAVSQEELYARTGIQMQRFNTIYQLAALRREHPEQLEQAKCLLMIPDYFHFRLTGVKRQEYTNATSTNLVNAEGRCWDRELIRRLGLPEGLFMPLSTPGAAVGELLPEIQEAVGFRAEVVLPATHDTGSAFLAVPARDGRAVYLSSGTWSLLGVENEAPITTEASRRENFTNEGGAWYRFRYLKNIMGLWMIQSIRRELNGAACAGGGEGRWADGKKWSFAELERAAEAAEDFPSVVDVNDGAFLAPESMIRAVKDACARSGQRVPESVGEVMRCVYQSLARCYASAIESLSRLTGRTYTNINIVGGGSQDGCLNRLTARASGLPVYAGPVEGTAIGNLIAQMVAAGEFSSLEEARNSIKISFDIQEVAP